MSTKKRLEREFREKEENLNCLCSLVSKFKRVQGMMIFWSNMMISIPSIWSGDHVCFSILSSKIKMTCIKLSSFGNQSLFKEISLQNVYEWQEIKVIKRVDLNKVLSWIWIFKEFYTISIPRKFRCKIRHLWCAFQRRRWVKF